MIIGKKKDEMEAILIHVSFYVGPIVGLQTLEKTSHTPLLVHWIFLIFHIKQNIIIENSNL